MLGASRDDTLYEGTSNQRNNGAGQWLFAGNTGSGDTRRGLIGFDIAGEIPAGATVTGASLTLNMSRSLAGAKDVGLHRVLADWQEGTADASGNEGSGADAGQGDVTWIQRVFKSLDWATPGGDFSPDASATAAIGAPGRYTWLSTSQLVADIQAWLDDPATNFGWLLLGDETGSQTTKRFDTKENETVANRPTLTVEYTK
ncbi:MAG: DNRLRE domain-containing protein [Chloroflexi bacterium]|nr:DNRLRE domain-containing protein [Chloroflexota bacterium]MDA1272233.1 DNRLRE domain-containing protein [Chloroflexota bacterium]